MGQNQIWAARNFNVKEGRFLTSGGLGTMGYSVPAAIGAKIAKPHRQVVAVCGDGSFQMCMCELGTLIQNGVDIKIIIMENQRLGMVREFQDRLVRLPPYCDRLGTRQPGFRQACGVLRHRGGPCGEQRSRPRSWRSICLQSNKAFILVCSVDPEIPSI